MSKQDSSLDEFIEGKQESTNVGEDITVGELQELDSSPIESWEFVKLGDILSLEYGDNLPSDSREDGNVPVYGSNGQVGSHSRAAIDSPGIILGRKGSIGEIEFSDVPFWPIDTTYYITEDKTDQNLRFLFYLLQNIQIERLNAASAIPGLNRNDVYALNAVIPPLDEQRNIASVLYNVDQAIQKTGEIIEQAERVKLGVIQELFTYGLDDSNTQNIHIGEFPEHWDFVKLSEVTDIERGDTPDTSNGEYYNGDIPWVTPDDLSTLYEEDDGKYISDTKRKLTESGVGSASLRIVEPNSVMFTSRSYGIGKTAICTVPAATNQGITAFECGDQLHDEFLYYYLDYIMDYIISISGVSTFPEISKSDTGNIDVPVPDIEEQEEIASMLGDIDNQIAHDKRTQNRLKRLKRGLMQDLLTGEVRTTDTDIEIPEEVTAYG